MEDFEDYLPASNTIRYKISDLSKEKEMMEEINKELEDES